MSSFTYFEEWATPKKWAYEWAYVSPQPTHLSARIKRQKEKSQEAVPAQPVSMFKHPKHHQQNFGLLEYTG